jgi:DNA repair ATPase RecN
MLTRPRYPNLFHRRLASIDENQQNTATNVDRVVTHLGTSIAKADELAGRVASLAPQLKDALTALQEIAENTKHIGRVEADPAKLAAVPQVAQKLMKCLLVLGKAETLIAESSDDRNALDELNKKLSDLSQSREASEARNNLDPAPSLRSRFEEVLAGDLTGGNKQERRKACFERVSKIDKLRPEILHFATQ